MRETSIPPWTPLGSLGSKSFLETGDEEEERRCGGSASDGNEETSRAGDGACVREHGRCFVRLFVWLL